MSKHHESNVQTTDIMAERRPDPVTNQPAFGAPPAVPASFMRDPSSGATMLEQPVEGGKHSVIKVATDGDKQGDKEAFEKFEKDNPLTDEQRNRQRDATQPASAPGDNPATGRLPGGQATQNVPARGSINPVADKHLSEGKEAFPRPGEEKSSRTRTTEKNTAARPSRR